MEHLYESIFKLNGSFAGLLIDDKSIDYFLFDVFIKHH